jgi:hypothetical protein
VVAAVARRGSLNGGLQPPKTIILIVAWFSLLLGLGPAAGTGLSAACPADMVKLDKTVCRKALESDACDITETCERACTRPPPPPPRPPDARRAARAPRLLAEASLAGRRAAAEQQRLLPAEDIGMRASRHAAWRPAPRLPPASPASCVRNAILQATARAQCALKMK